MAAKATFTLLDVDGDGRIKEYEALKSYKQWFKHFEKRRKRYIYPNIIVINKYTCEQLSLYLVFFYSGTSTHIILNFEK